MTDIRETSSSTQTDAHTTLDLDELNQSWTEYWSSGVLHSCACAYQGNYAGEIAALWQGLFAELPDGAVIADLGTGNGPIPLLAKQVAGERAVHFNIHGVDLASIDPATRVKDDRYAGITFHPDTSMTELPFADKSVDCVTGQYSLEYAPIGQAVVEILRVLRPGGVACFVIHDRDSLVLQTTSEQLETCAFLFEASDFFPQAHALCDLLANAGTPAQRAALANDPSAQEVRRRFNHASSSLTERITRLDTPDILQVAMGMTGAAIDQIAAEPVTAIHAQLDACEASLRGERLRLQALDRVAMDASQIGALRAMFEQAGSTKVEIGTIEHAPGQSLGYSLVVHA
ncbi:MAG: class I SAM-dependent methyltransferase [Lysobacteraceae bacterium]